MGQVRNQDELVGKLQNRSNRPASQHVSLKGLLETDSVKKRFEQILKNRASQYMSSIVNLVNSDTNLMECDPMSVIAACVVAATLDLPIDKNLGYAWVVPYAKRATFQLGYKGYIQLALRTGQYRSINALPIREGELISWNPLTEELKIDFTKRESEKIIGYAGYFELINGFRKTVYWSKEAIEAHRKRFSKSGFGWKNDWDAMALKTVIRNMLSKWGILSVEMQTAYSEDIKEELTEQGTSPDDLMFDTTAVFQEEVPDDVTSTEEAVGTTEPDAAGNEQPLFTEEEINKINA
ncbi:hypothetical protein AAC03nite_20510 [Alicyclobacillus acidoterrestris]|nr:hypothetical protein AAC03nite_20510 [Alicyclobacillus acidoterrestris]